MIGFGEGTGEGTRDRRAERAAGREGRRRAVRDEGDAARPEAGAAAGASAAGEPGGGEGGGRRWRGGTGRPAGDPPPSPQGAASAGAGASQAGGLPPDAAAGGRGPTAAAGDRPPAGGPGGAGAPSPGPGERGETPAAAAPMAAKVAELRSRRQRLELGGGPERIAQQRAKGKLTARERLALLLDPGSFQEIGLFVQHRAREFGMEGKEAPGDGVITGFGRIDGRLVYVFAQDFTVIGGTLGEMHAAKICKVMDLALETGSPLIGINDSGGARIQEGVASLDGFAKIFARNTWASGVIPQISVIMGPCAGGAVYSPAITDFVFMVEGTSQMFITGPDVIKAVTGETISFEELGGAATHTARSGVAHFYARDERECLGLIRRLLGYLPSNNLEDPPLEDTGDPPDRLAPELERAVPTDPNKPYDVRRVIEAVVDRGSFLEVHQRFAQSAVVGFARLAGQVVGVVANQPRVLAGCLDIDSSDKIARFVRFCDAFNIPLLTFVDTPGYLPGRAQEHGGIIRHGAKVLYAYAEATVPKISVVLRKAYGGAYIAMCCRGLGADYAFAWPTAEIAVMGPEGACNIVFRREIAEADDPAAVRAAKVREYREVFASPYVAAARGYVDDVIEPATTRLRVAAALASLVGKREQRPAKKHGNIPL